MRRARVPFVPAWRCISFLLGLLTVWVALASPLDTFSSFIITAHMIQHMLLMMIAPPLILLGAPLIPLVRGLPIFAAREFAGPFLNWRVAQRIGRALTNLWAALVLMGVVMFAWHTPRLYELALASSSWHEVEHACFFFASLIFWWPVVQPWPSRAQSPRWLVVPYLLLADLQNTALSAILVFSDRLLYPSYAAMPRLSGFSATHDQVAAGAIMWVMGSMAYVIPALIIAVQWLSLPSSEFRSMPAPVRLPAGQGARQAFRFARSLRRQSGARKAEAMTFILLFALAGVCLAVLSSGGSDDDDQVLRTRQTSGPFIISVFAAPDLQAGENDFAVLVQDSQTQAALPEATVGLRAQPKQGPSQSKFVRAATDSENHLLQSAGVELPDSGHWKLEVTARHRTETAAITLPLNVTAPEAGFALSWSWIVLIAFAAVLLFAYLWRHRAGRMRRSPEVLSTSCEGVFIPPGSAAPVTVENLSQSRSVSESST